MAPEQQNPERDELLWNEAQGDQVLYDLLVERRQINDGKLDLLGKPSDEVQQGIDAADAAVEKVERLKRARLHEMGVPRNKVAIKLGRDIQ